MIISIIMYYKLNLILKNVITYFKLYSKYNNKVNIYCFEIYKFIITKLGT